MRLFLVSLALMSLSSIPLPVSAEQQICELERADKKLSKEMDLVFEREPDSRRSSTLYIPENCEEGDLLYGTTRRKSFKTELLFLANCKENTYQKVWNNLSHPNQVESSTFRCIYRGKGNELKRRNGRPSNPYEKEK